MILIQIAKAYDKPQTLPVLLRNPPLRRRGGIARSARKGYY